MKPIYFPGTWLSEPVQKVLFACFDQIVIYSPHSELVPETHRSLAAAGRLDIRHPKEKAGDELPTLLASYRAWAQLHGGERPDFHKFVAFHPALPRDPSSDEIRSQILGESRGDAPRKGHPADPLLEARLFLAIAQQHDQQQAALANDLQKISDMQQDLLRRLSPEREETTPVKPKTPTPGSFEPPRPMAAERLAAWRLLHAHHRRQTTGDEAPPPSRAPLLVTADPDVFQQLAGSGAAATVVCVISDIPLAGEEATAADSAGREEINRALSRAAEARPPSRAPNISLSESRVPAENTASLTIYRMEEDVTETRPLCRNGFPVPHETGGGKCAQPHMLLGVIAGNSATAFDR